MHFDAEEYGVNQDGGDTLKARRTPIYTSCFIIHGTPPQLHAAAFFKNSFFIYTASFFGIEYTAR